MFDTPTNYGVVSLGDHVIINGNQFYNCGGTGDNGDGIYHNHDDGIISNNMFDGTMDRYTINIIAGADRTIISGNDMVGVTAQTANINDAGTSTTISNNMPQSVNSAYMTFHSSTTLQLQGTTPGRAGETYYNSTQKNVWIASGTAKNQFVRTLCSPTYLEAVSTNTQTCTVANVSYPITYSNKELNEGFTFANGTSTITFNTAGVYLVTMSAIGQTDTANKHLYIYPQHNGVGIARVNTLSEFAAANNEKLITVTWIERFAASDTFQLKMLSDDAGTIIEATAASGDLPASPSVILTINKIAD
jgi:hypothetical protein